MRPLIASLLLSLAASTAARAQAPPAGEFRVNAYTTGRQIRANAGADAQGNFVVVWMSLGQDGSGYGLFGQRFSAAGAPQGGQFQVNTWTDGHQNQFSRHGVSAHADGSFEVVWSSPGPNGFGVYGQRFDAAGAPRGGEFQVTSRIALWSAVGVDPGGGFLVVFTASLPPSGLGQIRGQRYDASGGPVGGELLISTYTGGDLSVPVVGFDGVGNFVVAWNSDGQDGSGSSVAARRFDAAGNPRGPEFIVNTYTTGIQILPSLAVQDDGSFVIAWGGEDGGGAGVLARRYAPDGSPVGSEFRVNTFTTSTQNSPGVAMDDGGRFVVSWTSFLQDGSEGGIFAQRFDAAGAPMGAEFRVNTYTTGRQWGVAVAPSPIGNFVVAWESSSQDGSDYGIYARRIGGLLPVALAADASGNGVLEPDEQAVVAPSWRNVNGITQSFGGRLSSFTGPPGATYTITDADADYGTVPDASTASCGGDCYGVLVSAPTRPALHWDASALESITPAALGQVKRWILHLGDSFADVPRSSIFYRFIETLLHHSVAGGCGSDRYCPAAPTTREQMPVVVLLAREGAAYRPPPCAPPERFADVPATSPFCPWIEELANRGVVSGCGGGNYCPSSSVTREQAAAVVLKALDPALSPPACAPPNLFGDVPETSPFCRWIEELARRGVVGGCGGGNYCPAAALTREEASVFLAVTFGLRLYGP